MRKHLSISEGGILISFVIVKRKPYMPKRNRQAGKEETNFVKKVFKDKLDSQEVIEDASENYVTEGSSRDIKTEPNNVEI